MAEILHIGVEIFGKRALWVGKRIGECILIGGNCVTVPAARSTAGRIVELRISSWIGHRHRILSLRSGRNGIEMRRNWLMLDGRHEMVAGVI